MQEGTSVPVQRDVALQPCQAELSAVLQKMGSKDLPQRQNISSGKIWSTGLLQEEQSGLFLLEKEAARTQAGVTLVHAEGITHGTLVRKAAILLSAALFCLPTRALSSSGLLSTGSPCARLLLSCILLLLQNAPSVQDAARTESHC